MATEPASDAAKHGTRLAPFNPTPDEVVVEVVQRAKIGGEDVVVDLGCGDARVLTAAVMAGAKRAVGYEYDGAICERARARIREQLPEDRRAACAVLHASAEAADLSDATVVFLYLVPDGIAVVRPALEAARERGARVVSHTFGVRGWDPTHVHVHRGIVKTYFYT